MAFNTGAQVEHQKFGLGTVVSSNDERIVIKFDDHGEKKFVTPNGNVLSHQERPGAAGGKTRVKSPETESSCSRGGL